MDVDGDGDLDLIAGQQLYLNTSGAVFVPAPAGALPSSGTTPCFSAQSTLVADLDGDGFVDVVDGCGLFHRNLGNGTFAVPSAMPQPLHVPVVHGDFDRDGGAAGPRLTGLTRTTVLGY